MKNNRRAVSLFSLISCTLFVFLVLGLRFWKLGSVPKTLYIDEVAMLADAKALVATGKDMTGHSWFQAIFPSYGDYKMPVYLWLVYLSSLLFTPSNFAVRLPSAVAGVLTIVLVFGIVQYVSQRYRKRTLSLFQAVCVTCLSVGISPWAIQFARTGFEAHVGQMLLGAGVLMLMYSRKRPLWVLGATLLALFATYSYFSVRYVWIPVYTTWVIFEVLFPITKQTIQKRMRNAFLFLLPIALFFVGMIPLFKSEYYQASMQLRLSTPSVLQQEEYVLQANEYREFAGTSLIDRFVAHRWYFAYQSFARNMSAQLSPAFLFISGDKNLRHGTGGYGLFLLPLMLPASIGIYVLARKEKQLLMLFFVWIVAAALPAAVPLEVPHALRFLNALIPLSVVIAIGLFEFWQWVTFRRWMHGVKNVIKIGYAGMVAFYVISFSCYYFSVYPQLASSAWEQENTEIAVAITPYLAKENNVAIIGMHDKFFLWLLAYGPYQGADFVSYQGSSLDERAIPNVSYQFPEQASEVVLVIIPSRLYTEMYQKKLEEKQLSFRVENTFTTSASTEFSVGKVTNESQED